MSRTSRRTHRQAFRAAKKKLLNERSGQLVAPVVRPEIKQAPTSFFRRGVSLGWKLIGGAGLLFGIFMGCLDLMGKVSVEPTDNVDLNRSASNFRVKNETPLSIKDVSLEFYVNYGSAIGDPTTRTNEGPLQTIMDPGFIVRPANSSETIPRMADGEPLNFNFPSFFFLKAGLTNARLTYFDVNVTVSFRRPFEFWKSKKKFRFVTVKDSDGHLKWVQFPVAAELSNPPEQVNCIHLQPEHKGGTSLLTPD